MKCRTIFISDVHLGLSACAVGPLAEFLRRAEFQRLYIVGDLIDFWEVPRLRHLPAEHRAFLFLLRALSGEGREIIFIPGNHDERLERYAGRSLWGIRVQTRDVITTASGRRFLIIHGHEIDAFMKKAHMRAVAYVGSSLYRMLLWTSGPVAASGKYLAKQLMKELSRYERKMSRLISEAEADGVICGHIHRPALRRNFGGRYIYANCGDWLGSNSAVIEDEQGRLTLYRYSTAV